MKRPTFFISSTIYDFSDLRSALKYYLEKLGCEVLTSERNDFKKSIDKHSYEACLESIRKADYFILLIGSRVGGWFDKENLISITRREYQEAYKLHCEGQLKVLNFVRSDIWMLKEDRNELKRFLENENQLERNKIKDVVNTPTKKMTNPEFIIDFLNEVGRNQETKDALDGNGEFPTGNWVHSFNSFGEIIDVITPEIFNDDPIEVATIKKLLLVELKEMLSNSLAKFSKGNVMSPKTSIQKFYPEHRLDNETKFNDYIEINIRRWDILGTLAIHLTALDYSPLILPESLSSSAFLKFDYQKSTFIELPVYKALRRLKKEIQIFTELNTTENLSVIFQNTPRNRPKEMTSIRMKTIEVTQLLNLMQRWSNIIDYCRAIIKYLEGQPYNEPSVFGRSPIVGMNEKFEEETVTEEELYHFIHNEE